MTNVNVALSKAKALCDLPVGWDYGRDGPASWLSLVGANAVLQTLRCDEAINFDVAPGQDGAITVVAINGQKEVEIHCRASGKFDTIFYNSDDVDDHSFETFEPLREKLRGEDWLPERSSTSCIQNAIYLVQGDIPARPSRTQVMGLEFPLSARNALAPVGSLYVITYGNSLAPVSRENPPYSGECDATPYPMAVC